MATAPRPGRVDQVGTDELTITFVLDDVTHVLYPNLVTGVDALAVREQVGISFNRLLQLLHQDRDTDVLAALVWVARCQAGETVSFDEVAGAVSYKNELADLRVDANGAPPESGHPLP